MKRPALSRRAASHTPMPSCTCACWPAETQRSMKQLALGLNPSTRKCASASPSCPAALASAGHFQLIHGALPPRLSAALSVRTATDESGASISLIPDPTPREQTAGNGSLGDWSRCSWAAKGRGHGWRPGIEARGSWKPLTRLAIEKLEPSAGPAREEGWAWVEVRLEMDPQALHQIARAAGPRTTCRPAQAHSRRAVGACGP
jgi:hypothetical protein